MSCYNFKQCLPSQYHALDDMPIAARYCQLRSVAPAARNNRQCSFLFNHPSLNNNFMKTNMNPYVTTQDDQQLPMHCFVAQYNAKSLSPLLHYPPVFRWPGVILNGFLDVHNSQLLGDAITRRSNSNYTAQSDFKILPLFMGL